MGWCWCNKKYFKKIDEFIELLEEKLLNPHDINQLLNNNKSEELVFFSTDYKPYLKIAATVQDPNLPQIYQHWLDKIPLENEAARNKLISFYENDIAEISRIVAAKNQGS